MEYVDLPDFELELITMDKGLNDRLFETRNQNNHGMRSKGDKSFRKVRIFLGRLCYFQDIRSLHLQICLCCR